MKFVGIVEGSTPDIEFVRFLLEARAAGSAGSRSMGGSDVKKQRGKCAITYLCFKETLVVSFNNEMLKFDVREFTMIFYFRMSKHPVSPQRIPQMINQFTLLGK